MIPKIIHQIWIGDQSKRPNEMIQSWIDKNPSWEHMLWTEDNLPELRNKIQFDAMKELPGKADILRYELLHDIGGMFIDADSVCINSLPDFLIDNDSFCCWENEYVRTGLMSNGYLGASKNNALMHTIIQRIGMIPPTVLESAPNLTAWKITGPMLLTDTVKVSSYNQIRIYPSHYFIPRHYTGLEYNGNETVYANQYWGSTETMQGKVGMNYGS
jgi:mannosyltransferase OCH1-like enzyme